VGTAAAPDAPTPLLLWGASGCGAGEANSNPPPPAVELLFCLPIGSVRLTCMARHVMRPRLRLLRLLRRGRAAGVAPFQSHRRTREGSSATDTQERQARENPIGGWVAALSLLSCVRLPFLVRGRGCW